jgi:hypothetical protein
MYENSQDRRLVSSKYFVAKEVLFIHKHQEPWSGLLTIIHPYSRNFLTSRLLSNHLSTYHADFLKEDYKHILDQYENITIHFVLTTFQSI